MLVQTRVPAAEVERGTIDVLLALPVSRWNLYVSETAAWLLTALLTLGAMFGGAYFGAQFIKPEIREVATPDWGRLLMVLANLGLVYVVVGCIASLFTTLIDRRTWAVLCTLVLTLFSLLVSFLHTIDPALEFTKSMRFLSVLDYYKPLAILRSGEWQVRDMTILFSTALTLWIVTGVIFATSRRHKHDNINGESSYPLPCPHRSRCLFCVLTTTNPRKSAPFSACGTPARTRRRPRGRRIWGCMPCSIAGRSPQVLPSATASGWTASLAWGWLRRSLTTRC
jgi:ABC-2 family transporter protein